MHDGKMEEHFLLILQLSFRVQSPDARKTQSVNDEKDGYVVLGMNALDFFPGTVHDLHDIVDEDNYGERVLDSERMS